MKTISIMMTDGKKIVSIMDRVHADNIMDQYYDLCSGQIDDSCLELAITEGKTCETMLIPFKNIYYISCREFYE
jgi:hypothetical protein